MEGTITIRGLSATEIQESRPGTKCNSGFTIETSCWVNRGERLSIALQVCNALEFDESDRMILAIQMLKGLDNPIWEENSEHTKYSFKPRRAEDGP